jgi:hypothetical protein
MPRHGFFSAMGASSAAAPGFKKLLFFFGLQGPAADSLLNRALKPCMMAST